MSENETILAIGITGVVAAGAAYAASRFQSTTSEPDVGSTQPNNSGVSNALLAALLAGSAGGGGPSTDPANEGNPDFMGENPAENTNRDADPRFDDETSGPDTGASGEGNTQNGYRYTGSDSDAFELWVSGDIGTQEFQQRTQPGEGTAAVANWDELGDPETDSTPNVADGGQPTTDPTTEADATSNPDPDDYYDPGMSEYIQNNPNAEIGDFGQYEGYHVFRDDAKLDRYEWVAVDDSGGWKAFDTESAAESFLDSGAADSPDAGNYGDIDDPSTDPANEGDAAFQGENPQDYGDTDDALGDDGSYTSPDDGASGEPAHRGADPTQYGDRFS